MSGDGRTVSSEAPQTTSDIPVFGPMPLTLPIYLDYHATTPVDPRVLQAMLPYFTERFGNAASRSHAFGWDADTAVERARQQVASLIGAGSNEIVFTSGATESNNLAIKGVLEAHAGRPRHIITTAIEHKSVLDTCKGLEAAGCRVTCLPVDRDGRVDPDAVRCAITDDTVLVSVMTANNEIGAIQPLAHIGAITRERGVLLHSDAAQAAGKIPLDVQTLGVDLLSFTAHKMYGPKGVGALYIRRRARIRLAPLLEGGGQERGVRSGTLNVPGIVGLGRAAEINAAELPAESVRLAALRDRLYSALRRHLDGVGLNGSLDRRLPHNLSVHFMDVPGESILLAVDDIALSSGSACSSGTIEPSYVLKACGVSDDLALSSIRFGLGRFTTDEEIDYAATKVCAVVRHLKSAARV
jgi:cysteine desulfurase